MGEEKKDHVILGTVATKHAIDRKQTQFGSNV
jgi:hypothetical protein